MTDQIVALACAVLGWVLLLASGAVGPYAVLSLGLVVAVPIFLFGCFAAVAGLFGVVEDCWSRKQSRRDLSIRFALSTIALAITLAPFIIVYLHSRAGSHR